VATISLCMIVKNETNTIARCLESVAGIPDEIIIVDTGSADDTKEIAARFTPRVLDFEWTDDFAAARNFSFAAATMDYILWLDSDDVLLPADRAKLLELKAAIAPNVDAVSMAYNVSFDANNNLTSSSRRLRLVRRTSNFTWTGVIHEDLEPAGPYTLLNSDIVITHQKEISASGPSRRNLEIFEKHIAQGTQLRPTDIFNYGRELQMHKEFDKAIASYLQFLDCKDIKPELALITLNNLATSYYMVGKPDKEWECTLKSLEIDIPRPEFSCRFGERFIAQKKFAQAIFWYDLALKNPGADPQSWSVDSHPFSTWLPHKQLALCYYSLGDYARSLEHNKAARAYLPDDADIATNIRFLETMLTRQT